MRTSALKSTVRATQSIESSSSAQQRALLSPAVRWLQRKQQQHRGLAKVNNGKELGLAHDVWFNSTGPSAYPAEGPGSGLDHRPPDERTLKLGKSMNSSLLLAIDPVTDYVIS